MGAGPEYVRCRAAEIEEGNSPRWSADGKSLYYLSSKSGSSQLWHIALANGTPEQLSNYPLDVNDLQAVAGRQHVLLSVDVFTDCADSRLQ